MTLADLIRGRRKTESVGVATAILAIPATQRDGEGQTVARIATVAVANPGDAKTAGSDARRDLSGVSPEFAARLSAEDLNDIAASDIPLGTVQAFEQAAIAREAGDLKEFFEERSAILEFDAGLPRPDAQLEAARITATYARNRGYLWASLRSAVSGYPVLLAQVPDMPGTVDSLPFGTATVHVHEGAKPGPVR